MSRDHTNSFTFLIYLIGLSIVGFLATDMYLPAFDSMRQDLETDKVTIGASLTLFLAGYAIAQLMWGPLSDILGKPKSIIIGLSIFVLSSLGIFFVNSVAVLLIFRLTQAIGVCAAAVSWQALVIERYPAHQTNRVFASIMPLVALSPALAPLVGVFLLKHFGWRSIFVVLALVSILLILYTFTIRPVTKDQGKMEDRPSGSYLSLLKNKVYVGNVLIYSFCSGSFFAWLTGSPFFLKELGYNESQIGFSFVPQTIAFILGGYGYRAIAARCEGKKVLNYLLLMYSVAVGSLWLITVFFTPVLYVLLLPFCLMALANGACYPIVVAEAMRLFPDSLGKASALQNALQLGICFLSSGIVSLFSADALATTTAVMLGTIPFVWIGFRLSYNTKNS